MKLRPKLNRVGSPVYFVIVYVNSFSSISYYSNSEIDLKTVFRSTVLSHKSHKISILIQLSVPSDKNYNSRLNIYFGVVQDWYI